MANDYILAKEVTKVLNQACVELHDKSKSIEFLEDRLEELESSNTSLSNVVSARDEELAKLRDQLKELNGRIRALSPPSRRKGGAVRVRRSRRARTRGTIIRKEDSKEKIFEFLQDFPNEILDAIIDGQSEVEGTRAHDILSGLERMVTDLYAYCVAASQIAIENKKSSGVFTSREVHAYFHAVQDLQSAVSTYFGTNPPPYAIRSVNDKVNDNIPKGLNQTRTVRRDDEDDEEEDEDDFIGEGKKGPHD